MGKLLGHQLKRHFSKNWFLVVAPFLIAIIAFGVNALNIGVAEAIFGFSFAGLWALYMAAAITVIIEDYNMFYGKSALFYQSVPINAGAKTFSRLFKYFILFFMYSVIYSAMFFAFVGVVATNSGEIDINDIKFIAEQLMLAFNKMGIGNVLTIIIFIIIIALYNISKIIFSISFGSEKRLSKFNLGGPVLVYAILSMIEVFMVFLLDKFGVLTNFAIYLDQYQLFIEGGSYVFVGLILLEAIILLAITYYEHKNRVSVS